MTTKRKLHELKIHPKYYSELKSGNKTFEIRKNDRDFQEGDEVKFSEWADGHFTHAPPLWGNIGYITNFEQKKGYVVFSVKIDKEDY